MPNGCQWGNERANTKGVDICNFDSISVLSVQIVTLNKNLKNLEISTMHVSPYFLSCKLCGQGGHIGVEYQVGNLFYSSSEQATFISFYFLWW